MKSKKKAVRPATGDLVKLGVRELHTYENNPTTFTWSDGAPSASALQGHDPASTFYFKDIRIKRLP